MFLSVIIPCKDEASRLPDTLQRIVNYLSRQPWSSEVFVVDDGSSDGTADCVAPYASRGVMLLQHKENRGKGAAIQTGVRSANGEFILFCDADLATPIAELEKLLPIVSQGYDLVIGSRALDPRLTSKKQPLYRRGIGTFGNMLIRILLGLPYHDTQCGFKLFRHDVAVTLFQRVDFPRWSFDYEILYRAAKRKMKVKEVAVRWSHSPQSKFAPIRDGVRCFLDLLRLRFGQHV